jgi:hypothetical protein
MLARCTKTALISTMLAWSVSAADVTIVLDFHGPHKERSVGEMKREFAGIMSRSGISFDWRTRNEVEGRSFPNLVMVKFNGKCVLEPAGYLYDERGPLAFTHSSDGDVLPFSEVACDKVAASVRSAMFGGDYAEADLLMGRALGRVVAHELIHILRNSKNHDRAGVEKTALSGVELIAPNPFDK